MFGFLRCGMVLCGRPGTCLLRQNCRPTPAEREEFVKATRPVYTKWKSTVGPALVEAAEKSVAAVK